MRGGDRVLRLSRTIYSRVRDLLARPSVLVLLLSAVSIDVGMMYEAHSSRPSGLLYHVNQIVSGRYGVPVRGPTRYSHTTIAYLLNSGELFVWDPHAVVLPQPGQWRVEAEVGISPRQTERGVWGVTAIESSLFVSMTPLSPTRALLDPDDVPELRDAILARGRVVSRERLGERVTGHLRLNRIPWWPNGSYAASYTERNIAGYARNVLSIALGLAFIAALTLAFVDERGAARRALALYPAVRRRKRIAAGLCPSCGYDLRGSPSSTCPECGGPRRG